MVIVGIPGFGIIHNNIQDTYYAFCITAQIVVLLLYCMQYMPLL